MRIIFITFALLFSNTAPAVASALTCPDLVSAIQVGVCPTEQELRYTYTGYCSDNARMYETDKETCTNFESYRRKKNVALWESGDGMFQAYLSCDRPPNEIKNAKVSGISVNREGKLTRVVCAYRDQINFVHRTKAECRVEGGAQKTGSERNFF